MKQRKESNEIQMALTQVYLNVTAIRNNFISEAEE